MQEPRQDETGGSSQEQIEERPVEAAGQVFSDKRPCTNGDCLGIFALPVPFGQGPGDRVTPVTANDTVSGGLCHIEKVVPSPLAPRKSLP